MCSHRRACLVGGFEIARRGASSARDGNSTLADERHEIDGYGSGRWIDYRRSVEVNGEKEWRGESRWISRVPREREKKRQDDKGRREWRKRTCSSFCLRGEDDVFEYLQLLDKNIFARLFQMFDHVLIGELKKIFNVVVANLTIELWIDVFPTVPIYCRLFFPSRTISRSSCSLN